MTLPDDNERGRPDGDRTTSRSTGEEARHHGTRPRRQSAYVVDVENLRRRVLQDALAQGLASNFLYRAEVFEWARPRPTDFRGTATPAELAERDARLHADAERCRRHAQLLLETHADAYAGEVRQVLEEVA